MLTEASVQIETRASYFGPASRPLLGWLTTPAGAGSTSGVVICPAVGYAYWSAHRTLRVLAERLGAAGHAALRIDYDATGDSAGDQLDPGRVEAWRASVAAAVAHLRALGCERISLVGVQLGATFALLGAGAAGAERVVAWAPATSGRRFVKQLRMISAVPPQDAGWAEGSVVQAGVAFSAQTLADLSALEVAADTELPARVLLVGTARDTALATRLDRDVEVFATESGESALERPAEDAETPEDIVDAAARFLGHAEPAPLAATSRDSVAMTWEGQRVTERVVRLGPHGLVAVESVAEGTDPASSVVFVNSGSEPHVGSGRAWVEYGRGLAVRGHRALRVDFRGWGESPDLGFAPGRPYDAHAEEDVAHIAEALRARGDERIALVGLCAGAWVALHAALEVPVDGVIALNPQLYWQPGDPVEALMTDTRTRREPERARIETWQRRGAWTALDVLGHRNAAARWLDALVRDRGRISFVFSEADDGLEYLESRLGRRLRRARDAGLRVREIEGVDHSAHRSWLRGRVLDAIASELEA